MSQYLFLRPSSQTLFFDWALTDDQKTVIQSGHNQMLSSLPRHASKTVLLAPCDQCRCSYVILPMRGRAKKLMALPFAIEENILGRIEATHVALGNEASEQGSIACAIEKRLIDEWQAQFLSDNRKLSAIVPEQLLLGDRQRFPNVFLDNDCCLLQLDQVNTIRCKNTEAVNWLEVCQETFPDHLELFTSQSEDPRIDSLSHSLSGKLEQIEVSIINRSLLAWMASHYVERKSLNLLQGSYTQSTNLKKHLIPWRSAAVLVAASFVLLFSSALVKSSQLNALESKLDTRIEEIYKQEISPGANVVEDVRLQTQQVRERFAQNGVNVGNRFFGLLGTLSEALAAVQDGRVESISYNNDVMEMVIQAPNVAALDQIKNGLVASEGISAELKSSTPRENHYEGRLQVTWQ